MNVLTMLTDRFPQICALARIIVFIPVSSRECERPFSLVNRIKSDWRARLTPETTSELTRINLNGDFMTQYMTAHNEGMEYVPPDLQKVSIEDYDVTPAVKLR